MKNYVKLPVIDSLKYLIKQYNRTVREVTGNDESICQERDCIRVSISIPTHRTSHEYKNDSLTLKNQISKAEKELFTRFDKKLATDVMENIREAEKSIDHSLNLEGLVLYAGCDFSTVVKLPVELKADTLIEEYFDLRPLYKAEQQANSYYILTVSQQKIRLMEAFNQVITAETENTDFPFINTQYYTDDPKKLSQDIFKDNQVKEFFNVADKRTKSYINNNPEPIILAGDVKSVAYYREMMDDDRLVIQHLQGNFDNTPTHEIVKEAYPLIEQYRQAKQKEHLEEILKAKSTQSAIWDLQDIYINAKQGNIKKIYLGNSFSLKGTIKDDILLIDMDTDKNNREITLNIIDEIQTSNGDILFLDDELLKNHNGMVAIRRY